jgi:AraC-like DNA-binding protein
MSRTPKPSPFQRPANVPSTPDPTHPHGRGQSLSTAAVPERDRYAYWIDMICSTYVQLECDRPSNDAEFFGDISFDRIGVLDLTYLRSNAHKIRRTPPQIRSSIDSYCLVQVQREGKGLVCQDGRMAIVNAGDCVLYDCTRPYELIFEEPHHDVVVIRLPKTHLETYVGNLQDLTATTIHKKEAVGHLLLSMVESLRSDIQTLHPSSALGVSDAIINVVAAGLRGLPDANLKKPSNLQTYHLMRIKDYVQQNLRDPELSVQSVAQALQVSSDHISRIFRTEPLHLSRLIWKQRLDACRRDLTDIRLAQRSISDIAYSWGFNNAAHFSRSFREEFQTSPKQWRELELHLNKH